MRRTTGEKVTIKDIARMCGVSPQTVSRVLNKRYDVSPATRRLVEETIERVGFQPSAVARSLVQRRSRTLGFVTFGLNYFGASQIVTGISEQCEANGYCVLVKNLRSTGEHHLLGVLESLIARNVEGVIVNVPALDSSDYHAIDHLPPGCPPLIVLKGGTDDRHTTISVDNDGGATAAVQHLLQLGRTKVGHIAGPVTWLESHQRSSAWRAAMAAAGHPVDDRAIAYGDWTSSSGATAFEAILDRYPEVDALFAANDQMALGALGVCHRHGLKVPQDVAVIGFDAIPESADFVPPLSTMHQPLLEMGAIAVTELIAQIGAPRGSLPAKHLVLDVQMVARESTLG